MLVTFHIKMIVCQIYILPHTYGQHFEKTPFMRQKVSNFSHGSQTHWFRVCEIDITNFTMV
jgi:hypothetical protein